MATLALVHEQLAVALAEETARSTAAQARAGQLEQRVDALSRELQTLSRIKRSGVRAAGGTC